MMIDKNLLRVILKVVIEIIVIEITMTESITIGIIMTEIIMTGHTMIVITMTEIMKGITMTEVIMKEITMTEIIKREILVIRTIMIKAIVIETLVVVETGNRTIKERMRDVIILGGIIRVGKTVKILVIRGRIMTNKMTIIRKIVTVQNQVPLVLKLTSQKTAGQI